MHLDTIKIFYSPTNAQLIVLKLLKFIIIVLKTFFYICTVHLDTIKVFYSPTNAQLIVLQQY